MSTLRSMLASVMPGLQELNHAAALASCSGAFFSRERPLIHPLIRLASVLPARAGGDPLPRCADTARSGGAASSVVRALGVLFYAVPS